MNNLVERIEQLCGFLTTRCSLIDDENAYYRNQFKKIAQKNIKLMN